MSLIDKDGKNGKMRKWCIDLYTLNSAYHKQLIHFIEGAG